MTVGFLAHTSRSVTDGWTPATLALSLRLPAGLRKARTMRFSTVAGLASLRPLFAGLTATSVTASDSSALTGAWFTSRARPVTNLPIARRSTLTAACSSASTDPLVIERQPRPMKVPLRLWSSAWSTAPARSTFTPAWSALMRLVLPFTRTLTGRRDGVPIRCSSRAIAASRFRPPTSTPPTVMPSAIVSDDELLAQASAPTASSRTSAHTPTTPDMAKRRRRLRRCFWCRASAADGRRGRPDGTGGGAGKSLRVPTIGKAVAILYARKRDSGASGAWRAGATVSGVGCAHGHRDGRGRRGPRARGPGGGGGSQHRGATPAARRPGGRDGRRRRLPAARARGRRRAGCAPGGAGRGGRGAGAWGRRRRLVRGD